MSQTPCVRCFSYVLGLVNHAALSQLNFSHNAFLGLEILPMVSKTEHESHPWFLD